ncbi:MAG TPA: SDR family NAD(P)-dependent oxidoreductase [Thermoplasmatales archaeon]|nr:SDR family NAD(P)-dependent oxidoreductase [Thermoplasmatales archaeon]
MRILVTGASGFIGRYLVRKLAERGYEVFALTRKNFKIECAEVIKGDITDIKSLIPAIRKVDAVFHNAGYADDRGKKRDFYRVNVNGTKNVAEACRMNGIKRIIYTSSAGVYGFPNKKEPLTEESPKKPMNAYHKSKLEGENVLKKYTEMKISVIRPPLVLGAGARAGEIILKRIENGKMAYIGDGENFIPIVHPIDVSECLIKALEKDRKGEVFNVVSFHCRIKELIEEIGRELNIELKEKHIPYSIAYLISIFSEKFSKNEFSLTRFRVKSFGRNRIISFEKAKKKLGYTPEYDLKKTIKEMVKWYKTLS